MSKKTKTGSRAALVATIAGCLAVVALMIGMVVASIDRSPADDAPAPMRKVEVTQEDASARKAGDASLLDVGRKVGDLPG